MPRVQRGKVFATFEAREAAGCGSLRLLRALRGTRILQAAAPTAPPCFGRWPRSSPLQTRGCSPLVTPKLLGSIQKIQAAPLKDFLCSADFESLARRAVRASLCSVCCANASAGSRRCKMPLPATTLSREKRKPEIRRFPAFITYERIVPLNMARTISGGHFDRGTQRGARRLYPALFL